MASGFYLVEMIDFMEKTKVLSKAEIKILRQQFMDGQPMSYFLSILRFPENIISQVYFAECHGNIETSLNYIKNYLKDIQSVKRKLIEVTMYPFILVVFLLGIMLGLNHYLIPQMEEKTLLTEFLVHFPLYFFITSFITTLIILTLILIWRKGSKMKQLNRYCRIPVLSYFIKLYMTAYYAREWGNLLSQGIELSNLLQMMTAQNAKLVMELGKDIENELIQGIPFHEKVKSYPFFIKELSLMIEVGQLKSKLGQELLIYADLVWNQFFSRLHKATQFIQPFIFLFVAVIIVMVYAAMLLPMYHNIGGIS